MKSLLPLLKAISLNKKDLEVGEIDDKLFDFIINSGLAAYFNYSTQQSETTNKSINNTTLISSELTAKFITNIQLQAIQEVTTASTSKVSEIILLKGISLCQNYYPSPHFRIMSDIDILVPDKDADALNTILNQIGYIQTSEYSNEFYESHHHSKPYYNKKNNVWIEVHNHLFSNTKPVYSDKLFDLENIHQNCLKINNDLYGDQTKYICPELQLIYTCTHCAEDFNPHKTGIQFIDIILLINNHDAGLDWHKISIWLENTISASYVYLILSYLHNNNIIQVPDTFFDSLKLKHANMSYISRQLLYKLINNYLLGGHSFNRVFNKNNIDIIWTSLLEPSNSFVNLITTPWKILFPPNEVNRYNMHFFLNRIKNMLQI